MSLLLAEAVADKTMAYLRANSDEKVADVSRRFEAEVDLPTFAKYSIADPEFLGLTLNDLPAVFVMPNDSDLEFTFGDGAAISTHRFQIAVIAFGLAENGEAAAETAKRASMRYLLAVVEMLREMHSHSDTTYHVNGGTIHWGSDEQPWRLLYPIMRSLGSGEYVADARLEVGVEHTEAL